MTKIRGKIIGAGLGWAFGGPLGALLGGIIGNQFDTVAENRERGFRKQVPPHTQQGGAFAAALLARIAFVSRVAGPVTQQE